MPPSTRRKKVAEARKAAKPTVTAELPFSDGPPIPKARNGNGAKSKAEAARKVREAKPIYANLNRESDYVIKQHALERMTERNISPAEVYSAIANPDSTSTDPDDPSARQLDRGDIRVLINFQERAVITVIDLEQESRTEPRVALTANLVVPEVIPAVLPDVDRVSPRVPKELPESEEMKWLFGKHTKRDVRIMDISSAVAKSLLDRNTRNRRKSNPDVDDWSTEMAAGRWRETSQGIGIARDGIIVDGQHRLYAIVDSGVTVSMIVVVGLDPEVFTVTDTGRRRTSADALGMVGETSTLQLAAITRACYEFDRLLGGARTPVRTRLHHDVLLAYRDGKEEPLREAVRFAQTVRTYGLPINKTAAGAAYFLIMRDGNDRPLAEEFFEGLKTGVSLLATDPRYVLRRVVTNDANSGARVRAANRHLALILKAWALFANGQGSRMLSWRGDEEMPVVFRSRINP